MEKQKEKEFKEIFQKTIKKNNINQNNQKVISPINNDNVFDLTENNSEYLNMWNLGIDLISNNKIAVLIMAGGSGSRLGFDLPKGMYVCDGIEESLFEIHISNLKRIQGKTNANIPLIIMTSKQTDETTQKYFKNNNYFGLSENNVYFFCQSSIPSFTLDGEFIIEEKIGDYEKISMSANGNGDIYYSLINSGIYDKLIHRNIEYLQVIAVDNILSRIADPAFFGISKNYDLAVKSISKNSDHESVGVFGLLNEKLSVIEYSEIGKDLAELKNSNGKRIFDCANIGSHIFRLNKIKEKIENCELDYHIAKKKIASINGKIDGIKLELFIFDLFKEFDSYVVAKVDRKKEYSPIKNASGNDSPQTAILSLKEIDNNDMYYSE